MLKITNYKGGHGLHQDSFKPQTMAALIKSFCRGGYAHSAKRHAPCTFPPGAGGKKKGSY